MLGNAPVGYDCQWVDSLGTLRVRGHAKVLCHLMFGIVALTVDQLMRLVT